MKRAKRARGLVHALPMLLAVTTWVCGFASASQAQGWGKNLYMQYCTACHGPGGKGDGVVSGLMRPKPPDLTQLTKRSGGKFPFYETIRTIDGRETVRAHGDSNMPVWGARFVAEEGDSPDAQAIARGKVVLIADYLESIQEK
jgi:mono/diheme cytochrome c family protein